VSGFNPGLYGQPGRGVLRRTSATGIGGTTPVPGGGDIDYDDTNTDLPGSPDTVQEAIEALYNLRWEAVTDGEDVFVWFGDDLVHEWKEYA
jgi:hypothetical protein